MDILLTGASGFVGRHLAVTLATEHRVIALNRRPSGTLGEIVHDFALPLPPDLLPRRIDSVIHTAGLVGHEANSSPLCQRINVDATIELANYAIRSGAKRFVFFSTGGIYQPTEGPLTEESAVAPRDQYTQSKLAAEMAIWSLKSNLVVQILRLFFPFGPTQRGRLIPNLIERVLHDKPIRLANVVGKPFVTPLYIDDLSEYLRRILEVPESLVANLAGDEALSIRALSEMIGKMLKRTVFFEINGRTAGNWWGSNELISRLTEYSPRVSLELGLTRTIGDATN